MDSASGSKEERLNKNLAFKLSELSWALLGMVLTSLCGGLAGFLCWGEMLKCRDSAEALAGLLPGSQDS